jgi:hypothetical protein
VKEGHEQSVVALIGCLNAIPLRGGLRMRKLVYLVVFAVVWCAQVVAQEDLKKYVSVLPSVEGAVF